MRKIIFYRRPDGSSPVEEFLDSLTGEFAQKVLWTMRLIEEFDPVPHQYFNKISKKIAKIDGLWEVRMQSGNTIFRVLGFFDGDDQVILTNGFIKNSGKIAPQEISLATRHMEDYLARKTNHE